MKNSYIFTSFFFLFICIVACKNKKTLKKEKVQDKQVKTTEQNSVDFVVAFGSCNKQNNNQPLWSSMAQQNPDIFIWGGDNIYADTDDMNEIKADYQKQLENPDYKKFLNKINHQVYGVWDDHDYGKNDAGSEWLYKAESQQLYLDFMEVDSSSIRRQRQGTYYAENIVANKNKLKLILLDTRYFRSLLQTDSDSDKRYKPWQNGEGSILGKAQWQWFENELKTSTADYHIIVSSIQVWADEHGFETWGNFPHEVDKLKELINQYRPKNLIILSGDRHISEFSQQNLKNYKYPILDFTSSGLTHAYSKFNSEENSDRIGNVVAEISYGLLKYNFEQKSVLLEMRNQDMVLQDYELNFE